MVVKKRLVRVLISRGELKWKVYANDRKSLRLQRNNKVSLDGEKRDVVLKCIGTLSVMMKRCNTRTKER